MPWVRGMCTTTGWNRAFRRSSPRFAGLLLAAAAELWALPVSAGDESSALSVPAPLRASETAVYLTLAPGFSSVGVLGVGGLTLEVGALQLSARASITSELQFMTSPAQSLREYALLVGKVWRDGGRSTYIAVGLGVADAVRRGDWLGQSDGMYGGDVYAALHGSGVTVPFEAGIAWQTRYTGIGLAMIGSVNTELPTIGMVVSLRMGKLL